MFCHLRNTYYIHVTGVLTGAAHILNIIKLNTTPASLTTKW